MISQRQMVAFANSWLMMNYGMTLNVPLKINGRLSKTYGCFKYKTYKKTGKKEPTSVDISKFFFENNTDEVILDVLKHELVHYALFMQGKPMDDGHPYFEAELKRLGVVSQDTIDKYRIKNKPVNMSIYKCLNPDCGAVHKRRRALPRNRIYKCSCGGVIESRGKRKVEVS